MVQYCPQVAVAGDITNYAIWPKGYFPNDS